MIGRWFNQWIEDRLAVAITLAADMRQAVDLTYAPLFARGLTPAEAATIGAFCAQHGLRPKAPSNVVPFPTANDQSHSPAPPEPAA